MSLKSVAAIVLLAVALAEPAMAERLLGFGERTVVLAPWSPYGVPVWYPPYLPYEPGAYFRPPPFAYGLSPEYVPGANWRDNWYDATRTKVHGYTLR